MERRPAPDHVGVTTVRLDEHSVIPPSEQVRAQIADAIHGGRLRAGTRLPTVRQLAGDLGIAPNTVARAYRELEEAGLVHGRGRRGTIVVHAGMLSDRERERRIIDAARRYVAEVARAGGTVSDARRAVDLISNGDR